MLSYDCIDNNINLENIISKWWFEKKNATSYYKI